MAGWHTQGMGELIQVNREFLQRALGWGEDGNPANVEVVLDTLPPDFPVDLSGINGMQVLGGIRSVVMGWTFQTGQETLPKRQHWRVFLDMPGAASEVFSTLLACLSVQGWQPAVLFQQTFVEAEQTSWLGVQASSNRQIQIQLRTAADITQVWLTVSELEERHARHLLGEHHYPVGFEHMQHYEAPMPTLTLPPGWKAQMRQGSGGPVRSQDYSLQAPPAGENLAQALLAHLTPQLEQQGWQQVYQEGQITVYRTALGIGVLTLKPGQDGVQALIVHATSEEGRGPNYTVVSPI